MKRLLLLSLIIWFACSDPIGPDNDQNLAQFQSDLNEGIAFNEPFALPFGTKQEVGDDGLVIGFKRVIGDSRCRLEVVCCWAGQARICLWLLEPGADTIYVEPFIDGYVFQDDFDSHKRVFTEKYVVTLMQLDPYPSLDTLTYAPERDTALISVSLNEFPLLQDRLLPVDPATYHQLSHNRIDGFGIDSATVAGDTLLVYVNYSGGCREHDFFLFGTTGLEESIMPMVQTVLIHDDHADFCEAFIHRILRFDLLPVRQLVGRVSPVVIAILGSPDSIVYAF
ncbi:hypothetical protein ACFL6Q_02690 [Candidatus Neomarinimicrobiota bacterium]